MNISRISCHGRNFPDLSAADKISFDCIRFQGGVARHRLFERLPFFGLFCVRYERNVEISMEIVDGLFELKLAIVSFVNFTIQYSQDI